MLHKNTVVGGIATVTSDIFAPSQMSQDLTEATVSGIGDESIITHAGTPRRVTPQQRHSPQYRKERRPRFAAAPSNRWLAGETPGVEELIPIVGSKGQRDIKRSVNFMPGAFNEWNDKQPKGRYWGGFQDVDHDGLADEFVVRRGGSQGNIIAINGYTTKRSDWPMRSLYYDRYPTRELRKELPVSNRMKRGLEKYYGPDFQGGLAAQTWRIEPGSEDDPRTAWGKVWEKIRYPQSSMSAYQGYIKYIAQPMIKQYAKELAGPEAKDEDVEAEYKSIYSGQGVSEMSKFIAEMYNQSVRDQVIIDFMKDDDMIYKFETYMRKRMPSFQYDSDNETHNNAFMKWLSTQKAVKDEIKSKFVSYLQNKTSFTLLQEAFIGMLKHWIDSNKNVSDYFGI